MKRFTFTHQFINYASRHAIRAPPGLPTGSSSIVKRHDIQLLVMFRLEGARIASLTLSHLWEK